MIEAFAWISANTAEFINAAKLYILEFLAWHWVVISLGVSGIAAVIWRERLKKRARRMRAIRHGWVTFAVEEFKKERLKHKGKQRIIYYVNQLQLPHPSRLSLFAVLSIIPFSWCIQWLLGKVPWALFSLNTKDFVAALLALWQVQVGLAAAALPILIFIIELTKDEGLAATKSSEVLIRETWIFPIIVFSLSSSAKTGLDVYHNSASQAAGTVNLLLFCLSVSLAIFAYYRAIRLMFNPALLRTKSIKLMQEKMEESVMFSVETRVGNNWLKRHLEEAGIDWYPLGVGRDERERFHVVDAWQLGHVVNINVEYFKEYKEKLDLKPVLPQPGPFQSEDTETSGGETAGEMPRKAIYIAKTFRDRALDRNRALILVEKAAVNTFSRTEADTWARRIFIIEADDEE